MFRWVGIGAGFFERPVETFSLCLPVECPEVTPAFVDEYGSKAYDPLGSLKNPSHSGELQPVGDKIAQSPSITPLPIGHPFFKQTS